MEYLIKTPSFCYLQRYDNEEFRNSKKLTLNRAGFNKIENYLERKLESPFINYVVSRGFSLENVSVKGSFKNIFPMHMQLELIDKCNLSCDYCYQNASPKNKKNPLNLEYLYSFLLERKKESLLEIGVTGGEATIHPNFLDIINFLLGQFELVELISNGTNTKTLLKMFDKIGDKKKKLNLSLSFNRWYGDLPKFIEGKHYLNRTLPKIMERHNLRLIATDLEYSKKAEDRLRKKLEEYRVTELDFSYIIPIGRAKEKLDEKESLSLFPYGKKKNKCEDYMVNCGLNFKHLVLDTSGNLRPCTLFPKNFVIGSLEEGFNGEFDYLNSLPAPSQRICGKCEFLDFCMGCVFKGMFNSKEDCSYKEFIQSERRNIFD